MLFLFPLSLWGMVAGLYAATIGAIKDAPYEGFSIKAFFRSVCIGFLCGVLVWFFFLRFPETKVAYPLLFFFICIGLERQITEVYKQFFRREAQEKYKIPSRATFFGKVIEDEKVRALVGLSILVLFFSFVFWLRSYLIQANFPQTYKIFIASSVGGIYISVLGAYKDAPFEGFDKLKVWRSALLTIVFGFLLAGITNDYIMLGYAAAGAERTTIESYKAFISRKKPGKFKDTKI